jgi:hypothetical protein
MLLHTIYEIIQINLIVNFKGNRAKRHARASSNICRMVHAITDWSLESDQKIIPMYSFFVKLTQNKLKPRGFNTCCECSMETLIDQGTVPYSRLSIEKKTMYTFYLRCNSVTHITIQRNTKSYKVVRFGKKSQSIYISRKTPLRLVQ